MKNKLKQAAEEGILLGVKFGLASIISILLLGFIAKDYLETRQNALLGRAAAEYIQKAIEAQKKEAPSAPK